MRKISYMVRINISIVEVSLFCAKKMYNSLSIKAKVILDDQCPNYSG